MEQVMEQVTQEQFITNSLSPIVIGLTARNLPQQAFRDYVIQDFLKLCAQK